MLFRRRTTAPRPLPARQLQRIAAACNGVEVANRWLSRLDELSKGYNGIPSIEWSSEIGVFLGGSCGTTTWRREVAMSVLLRPRGMQPEGEQHGVAGLVEQGRCPLTHAH